jgi:hypothetical protein
MSNGSPPPFTVQVNCVNGATSANPPVLPVPWAGSGKQVTINWNAIGGNTFPTSGYFSWKSGSSTPGSNPTRVSNTQLQLTYTAPSNPVTYQYNIKLNNCTQQDPDIDNQRPPGDEGDFDKPRRPQEK